MLNEKVVREWIDKQIEFYTSFKDRSWEVNMLDHWKKNIFSGSFAAQPGDEYLRGVEDCIKKWEWYSRVNDGKIKAWEFKDYMESLKAAHSTGENEGGRR